MIKLSQTLNDLPHVDRTVYLAPINDIAASLSELALSSRTPYPIYYIENSVGQSWQETKTILANAFNIPNLIPFQEWVQRVRAVPRRKNTASILAKFLDSNYLSMSYGGLVLDTKNSVEYPEAPSTVEPVSKEVVRKCIHIWKEIGFLS